MENLTTLENLTDDLKKQLWDLTKNIIPTLEEKIASGGSEDSSALKAEIATINETLAKLTETTIPELEEKISAAENTELETEIANIKSTLSNLTDEVIPNIENKIAEIGANSGGGASGGEQWTTVYDMNSEDESLNWGCTTGLTGSQGLIANSISFTPYSYMRVYYVNNGNYKNYHDFYIGYATSATHSYIDLWTITRWEHQINILIGQSIGLKYDSTTSQHLLYMGIGRYWQFRTSGYPLQTNIGQNTAYRVEKILVKT